MWQAIETLTIRFAGTAGEGVIVTGEVFARTLSRLGLHVFNYSSYEAEVRGERPSTSQVRVSSRPILSQGDLLDILVAFGQRDVGLNIGELKEGGYLIYDPRPVDPFGDISLYQPEIPPTINPIPLPTMEMAYRGLKRPLARNMVILGVLSSLLKIPEDVLKVVIEDRFKGGGRMDLRSNLEALEMGYRYGEETLKGTPFLILPSGDGKERMVISGNEAISLGAIRGGVDIFSGYPITPASEIMEFMAKTLPQVGGVCVQMEDEMASLGLVIGASFGGKVAFTATSGPGLSLMAELIGLASMARIPAVIVDVQRGGPSTGMPTKTEQSDLLSSIFGSHGEAPRVVIGVSSVEDAFYTVQEAFNLAWGYRLPVIILMDQFLGQRRETIEGLRIEDCGLQVARGLVSKEGLTITGLEHMDDGTPDYSPEVHKRNMEERFRVLGEVSKGFNGVRYYGEKEGDVGIFTWGSSLGVVLEAVQIGPMKRIGVCEVRLLNPLPKDGLIDFAARFNRRICIEANFMGQLAGLIEGYLLQKVERLNIYEGRPIKVKEIVGLLHHALCKSRNPRPYLDEGRTIDQKVL